MKEKLLRICQGMPADYCEVRVHEGSATTLDYAGKELEDIGERTGLGGCVRVLKDGGWGFTTFNDLSLMEKYARLALKQADHRVLCVGYANDWLGYIAPPEAFEQGGYEVSLGTWAIVGPAAFGRMVETGRSLVETLW